MNKMTSPPALPIPAPLGLYSPHPFCLSLLHFGHSPFPRTFPPPSAPVLSTCLLLCLCSRLAEVPTSLADTLGGVEKGMRPSEMSGPWDGPAGGKPGNALQEVIEGYSLPRSSVPCALAGASPGLLHMCGHKNMQETISKPHD